MAGETRAAGWRITHDVAALHKKGEDAHAVHIVDVGDETLLLALVADGHGGARASSTLAEQLLPKVIEEAENTSAAALETAMLRSFAILHAEIRKTAGTEGSTATVVAIALKQGTITCGNVSAHARPRTLTLVPAAYSELSAPDRGAQRLRSAGGGFVCLWLLTRPHRCG